MSEFIKRACDAKSVNLAASTIYQLGHRLVNEVIHLLIELIFGLDSATSSRGVALLNAETGKENGGAVDQ